MDSWFFMKTSSEIPWVGARGHANYFRMKALFAGFWLLLCTVYGEPWPSFRGLSASGVAPRGQDLPDVFDVESGKHIQFRVPVDGLAHSSPVIWGDRLFVSSAVNQEESAVFKPGLYGTGQAAIDRWDSHQWQVVCFDKHSGEVLWKRVAAEGKPIDKRHVKATYANSSPVTDGEHVVAFFGSHGLYGYTVEGELRWKMDLGKLDVGAYDFPEYEWGSASSPIIYEDLVILQCDIQHASFIAAFNVKTGEQVWRTVRKELPSWGTPTVYPGQGRHELICNGSNYIRAYSPRTGEELWRLGGSSKITAPTPFFAQDLIVVASGRAPERPVFVIKPGGNGTLDSDDLAWKQQKVGPYMPTPIVVGDELYTLNNNGVFHCFDLKTGKEHYQTRVPHGGLGFSASPVAADGKIYCSSESGEVIVLAAGTMYQQLAVNILGESLMATPAISDGVLYIRGTRHLVAVSRNRR